MVTLEGLHVLDSIEDRNQKPQAGLESGQVLAHALDHLRSTRLSARGGKRRRGCGKQYPCLLLRNKEDAGVDGRPIPANVGEGGLGRVLLRYSTRRTERADKGDNAGKGLDGLRGDGSRAEEWAERRTAERAVHSQHFRGGHGHTSVQMGGEARITRWERGREIWRTDGDPRKSTPRRCEAIDQSIDRRCRSLEGNLTSHQVHRVTTP
jgi:hypothetical protein